MRFIIIHKTTARWEAGEVPGMKLIKQVGALIGDMQQAGVLRAGEGLRASSLGARMIVRDHRVCVKLTGPPGSRAA